MASRTMKVFEMCGRKVMISLQTMFKSRGYKILPDVIEPSILEKTVQRAEDACSGGILFTPDQKAKLGSVMITSETFSLN